jgi:hypothetical protein
VLIFRTITSGPRICEAKKFILKSEWSEWPLKLRHLHSLLRSPVLNTHMSSRSLSPTLKNITYFSRFVAYTVMTFGERKGPSVVIYTFSMQYICNVSKSAWVFYIFVYSYFVCLNWLQSANLSRNWQLRKFDGRSFEVCCMLVEVSFMHFLSDVCNNTNINCVLLAHVLFVSCLLDKILG